MCHKTLSIIYNLVEGGELMEKDALPLICREIQIEIMKFFLHTSIPRILKEKEPIKLEI